MADSWLICRSFLLAPWYREVFLSEFADNVLLLSLLMALSAALWEFPSVDGIRGGGFMLAVSTFLHTQLQPDFLRLESFS